MVGFREPAEFDFDDLVIPNGPAPTLQATLDKEVDPKYTLTRCFRNYLQDRKEKYRRTGNGFGYSLVGPDDATHTLSTRNYRYGSEILVKQHDRRPRRLTPPEFERLMGFEKPGETKFRIPESDP